MARYRVATPFAQNIWIDTETGVSFAPSNTREYTEFEAWCKDGNTPDPAPEHAPIDVNQTRQGRLQTLANHARTQLDGLTLTTPDGRALAVLLRQVLDGLVALDPVPQQPASVIAPMLPEDMDNP